MQTRSEMVEIWIQKKRKKKGGYSKTIREYLQEAYPYIFVHELPSLQNTINAGRKYFQAVNGYDLFEQWLFTIQSVCENTQNFCFKLVNRCVIDRKNMHQ